LITTPLACTTSPPPPELASQTLPSATDTPAPTDTPDPTDTPAPTDTPLPTETPTLEPTVTHDLPATFAAESTQNAEKAFEEIKKELEVYGIQANEGQLAWLGLKAVTLSVNTYGEWYAEFIDPDLVVQDFIFQTDVTWESTGGLATCGLIFRAEEDLDRGAYYEFASIRLSGLPMWFVHRFDYNTVQDDMTAKYPFSSAINQKQGSMNKYAVIARGNSFTFYANGDRLGTVFNSKLPDGRIAYTINQESGETTCVFENSWLFELVEP
jgi:hypothetical protein